MSTGNPLAAIFPHLKKKENEVEQETKEGKEGENANAITPSAAASNVDYTILIAIFVVAGVLFLALLIWAIYSTQTKSPMMEHHDGEEHKHHHGTPEKKRRSSRSRRRS